MRVWRLSRYAALDGAGGLHASGRWHTRGRPVVYAAESASTALLEVLVHLEVDPEDLPDGFLLLAIDIPDDVAVDTIEPGDLAPDWMARSGDTQAAGGAWLASKRSAVLRVPSVIMPVENNVLINTAHPDHARIRLMTATPFIFDGRLFRR